MRLECCCVCLSLPKGKIVRLILRGVPAVGQRLALIVSRSLPPLISSASKALLRTAISARTLAISAGSVGIFGLNLNRLSTERRQSMSFLVSAGPNPGTILIECDLTSQAVSLLLGRLSHPSTPAARLPMRSDAVDAEKTGSDGIDPPAAKTGQGPWHCCKCSCVICPLGTPRHPDGATNEPAGGLCRKASRRGRG